jgi:hypothetical protein
LGIEYPIFPLVSMLCEFVGGRTGRAFAGRGGRGGARLLVVDGPGDAMSGWGGEADALVGGGGAEVEGGVGVDRVSWQRGSGLGEDGSGVGGLVGGAVCAGGLRSGARVDGVDGRRTDGGSGVVAARSAGGGTEGAEIPRGRWIRGGSSGAEFAWGEESVAGAVRESAEKYGKVLSSKTTCLDTITRRECKSKHLYPLCSRG